MLKVQPLKRFGQNYIRDKNTILKIIDEFQPLKDDNVLEIGPGTGALTSVLSENLDKFYAVEIDKRVVDDLREKFPKVDFSCADVLKINLNSFVSSVKKLRIIGNIPYNITSPILFKLIEERKFVEDAMFMVQFEVAKRITAEKRTKDYGILSVLLNYFAETKLCFKISPNVFFPVPKVYSAIIHLYFNKESADEVDDKMFIKVVKAAFGNRRKTLKNSLGNSIFKEIKIDNSEFDLTRRAEELSIAEFVDLTKIIHYKMNNISG
jgi:16S rRNA (adenine1518-N6/adenine1519-N6)-dimethyltransferase